MVDNATIGPINADLGALSVQQLTISYSGAANEWRGQGKACVLGERVPRHDPAERQASSSATAS